MNYRLATILDREAVAADKTRVIDLNLQDPVSQIQVVYESTGVSSGAADGHAAKCVTKIELVDGSDVLFSLSGQEAQALDFYHNKKEPVSQHIYLPTMNAEEVFNMNFGRWLWDTQFAFDPRKFRNPQLKITIDLNAGGMTSVAGFLQVLAHIFDGKQPNPSGMLLHKEIKDYQLGSASHEYTDLPTDFPIRKLLIKSQTYGTGPEYLLDTIKLTEDNDRKIPVNCTMFQLLRAIMQQTPPYREFVIVSGGASGLAFYCTPAYWPKLSISQWEGSNNAKTATVWQGDGGRGYYYLEGVGNNYMIGVEGHAPHGVVEIPFGDQMDENDWYQVDQLGSLVLDIKSVSGRSSTDTVQVFLQQLRPF